MVVPGGGLSADGSKWIACRPDYFLCVEVLSALFRRLFLEMLVAAHDAGRLQFFGDHVGLADRAAFNAYIAPLRDIDWVIVIRPTVSAFRCFQTSSSGLRSGGRVGSRRGSGFE
jgi:hypothetical protein